MTILERHKTDDSRSRHLISSMYQRLLMLAISATLFACSIGSSAFDPLLNQGLLPVSDENPFTGSNLFLAKEMERSIYLYNFIKEKGPPGAIELKGSSARNVETHLFYKSPIEEYVAKPAPTRSTVGERGREWIIIGPFSLERDRYREVRDLPKSNGAVFELFGKREVIGRNPLPETTPEDLRPVFVPTPAPPKQPEKKRPKSRATAPEKKTRSEDPQSPTSLNFDQQALKEARDYAPRDTNGDVIHTVTKKNETLQSISQWYTSSASHSAEIAKRNNLSNDAKLTPGAKVSVPSALITNPKRME